MLIDFVSNIPQGLRSGGFSALSSAAFAALGKDHSVRYAGPINPPAIQWQRAWSKLLRITALPGDFFFFSQRRLKIIAREVQAHCFSDARLVFFHGFTPWSLSRPEIPYIALSDCTFHDYIDIFHANHAFRAQDIQRIEHAEARWLQQARLVLFTSEWAAGRAVRQYSLDPARVRSVGIFGEISLPDNDAFAGGKEFAFIATNFEGKGGRTALAAFRELRQVHPDAGLTIVGHPPPDIVKEPGVKLAGFLRKEVPNEYGRYKQLLGTARAVIHPTQCDIAPLLLVEAACLGCPAISTNKFAIPELVVHGRTGFLVSDTANSKDITAAMAWMIEHDNEYLCMRKAAWVKAREDHSKDRFERRLLKFMQEVISPN